MSLISLLVIIIVLGLVFWLVTRFLLPLLPEPWRTVAIVIFVIIVILILLSFIGIGPGIKL